MNYTQIIALALSYSDRTDAEVSNRLDDFLRIVEARVNRVIKTMGMEVRTHTVTYGSSRYYALPIDFEGMRNVEVKDTTLSNSKTILEYATPEHLDKLSNVSGLSSIYYTVVANQIEITPILPDGKILEFIYYRKLIPLTALYPENWVSMSNPDIYVFGLLIEIAAFLKDPIAKQLWDERFKESLAEIQINDSSRRWVGTAMKVRIG